MITVRIKRVVVSTYQAAGGAGKAGMDELFDQTKGIYETRQVEPKKFPKRLAFNVIPHCDAFLEDGSTKEEWKNWWSRPRRFSIPRSRSAPPAWRVPVFVGHSEAVNVEFEHELSVEDARDALYEAPGVQLIDKPDELYYATAARLRRRVRRPGLAPAPGRHGAVRPQHVGGRRQFAQGCCPQRRADRRMSGGRRADLTPG